LHPGKISIFLAGDWEWEQYEKAFAAALEEIGHTVIPFKTTGYFDGLLGRLQRVVPFPGLAMLRMNFALRRAAISCKPDLFFAWRCTHLLPSTIRIIKSKGIRTVSYNNDDPFNVNAIGKKAPWHHHFLWYWYIKDLKYFDLTLVYRTINIAEALRYKAKRVKVLKSCFLPSVHRPVKLTDDEEKKFGCDVVFVGHYEPDDRVSYLKTLVDNGIQVKVYGEHYWNKKNIGDLYDRIGPIVPALGDDYVRALCGAKICLVFLSKLNRDTYTRRCFEIPACGKVMLAERTDDLLKMFTEGKEACYFSDSKELTIKVNWLLENPGKAESIANAGLKRVWTDKHDVNSRAREFIELNTSI
jgi:glycosyltransferase involved in cell wall biosynthesis